MAHFTEGAPTFSRETPLLFFHCRHTKSCCCVSSINPLKTY